jgi:hypothetical protein
MPIEMLGQYQLELCAMQLIQNGGWAAYAAIRSVAPGRADPPDPPAQHDILAFQRVADDAVFVSEAAAIAGARCAAMALLVPDQRDV